MTQSECTSEVNFRLCKSVFATLAAQGRGVFLALIPDELHKPGGEGI